MPTYENVSGYSINPGKVVEGSALFTPGLTPPNPEDRINPPTPTGGTTPTGGPSPTGASGITSGVTTGGPAPTGAAATYVGALDTVSGMDTTVSAAYEDPNVSGLYAKPGSSYITPEGTVAGQLESLLSKDSALMKRSTALGKQMAGSLGLQSSTAGIGMVAGALYDRALQIATPDAATYAQAQLNQQKADLNINQTLVEGRVSSSLQSQKANLDAQTIKMKAVFDTVLAGADAASKESLNKWMAEYEHGSTMAQIEAQGKIDKMLQDGVLTANQAEQGKQSMMQQVMNTQISIENALRDPEILALGPEAMNALLNKLKDTGIASMKMIAGMYSLPASAIDMYSNMIHFEFTPPPAPSTFDTFLKEWNNYKDIPPPPNVPSGQWSNEAWRKNWIKTHPESFDVNGKPKWW